MADALKGYKTPYPSCTDQDHASEASMLVQHRVLQCNQGAVTSAKAEPFRKGDPTVLWPHMARHACPGGLHWGKLIKKGGCLARHSLWRPEGPGHASGGLILHVHIVLVLAQPLRRILRSSGACPPHPPAPACYLSHILAEGGPQLIIATIFTPWLHKWWSHDLSRVRYLVPPSTLHQIRPCPGLASDEEG